MPAESLLFSFVDSSTAEGNRLANYLGDALRDISPDISVERVRTRTDTQDFGASLAIILGTAAATALARGIGTKSPRKTPHPSRNHHPQLDCRNSCGRDYLLVFCNRNRPPPRRCREI